MRQSGLSLKSAPEPATLTVEEAAAILGINRQTAYEGCRAGTIPSIRIGKRILVSRAGLERLLQGAA